MPERIDVRTDATRLLERLRNPHKRIAFAVVNSINATLKDIQTKVREFVARGFTIRKPAFVLREAAIIKPFANVRQGRAFGEVSIGQKNRFLLSEFVAGGIRQPFTKGAKNVAVPDEARPSESASVPEELHVRRLQLRRQKATTTATRKARRKGLVGKVWTGLRGTFLIPGSGIFQRVGHAWRSGGGLAGVRRLYGFAKAFRLRPMFPFVRIARDTAATQFPRHLTREVDETLNRHNGRRV